MEKPQSKTSPKKNKLTIYGTDFHSLQKNQVIPHYETRLPTIENDENLTKSTRFYKVID